MKQVIEMREKTDTVENWFIDAGPADLAFSFTFHGKIDNNLRAFSGLDLRIRKTS